MQYLVPLVQAVSAIEFSAPARTPDFTVRFFSVSFTSVSERERERFFIEGAPFRGETTVQAKAFARL
jgi:hypothetical protein